MVLRSDQKRVVAPSTAGDGRFARFHGKSGLSTNLGVWKQNLCGLLAMLSIVVEIRSQLMAVRILEF